MTRIVWIVSLFDCCAATNVGFIPVLHMQQWIVNVYYCDQFLHYAAMLFLFNLLTSSLVLV